MITAIKRGTGIEGLLEGLHPKKLETTKPLEVNPENNPFFELLKEYEALLGRVEEYNKDKWTFASTYVPSSSEITDVLTPEQINAFLQTTIKYEERREYQALTGIFITKLIQNSYNAGNNNFQLNTKTVKELDFLGAYLKGKSKRKLQITITGDVGDWYGSWAQHSTYSITGDVGDGCGSWAQHSTYTIEGDVGDLCGYSAKNSTYTINGDVGDWCGSYANNSTYSIDGDVGNNCGYRANNSTFKIIKKDRTEEVIRR